MEYKGLIKAINNAYCYYRQKYVTFGKNGCGTVPHPYSDQVIKSHLDGKYACAVFAGEEATRFMTIDIDAGGKNAVRTVMAALVEIGIPSDKIYISTSGKKGYHVDIFFDPYIYNRQARNLYELMIWRTGLNPKKVEFYPTNNQAIKIPLGIHPETGKRCWYMDRETLKPIKDFEYIYQIAPIKSEIIQDILRIWNKKHWNELYAEMITEDTGHDQSCDRQIEFDNDYYESKRIMMPGTRHDTMLSIACDLRNYGANRYQIIKALRGFYYHQDKSLIDSSEREVLDNIDDIAKWAEESVPVRKARPGPNDGVVRSIKLSLQDAENVLSASTSASRKVALLIYAYCRMFGVAHLSYNYIAETVGCSVPTVKNAIRDLTKLRIVSKKSGGCHYCDGRLVRQANTYFVPADYTYNEESYFEYAHRIDINDLYYKLLTHFFSVEYLKKYLTKPEIEKCMEVCASEN